jgi:hypothetical protein
MNVYLIKSYDGKRKALVRASTSWRALDFAIRSLQFDEVLGLRVVAAKAKNI